MKVCLISSKLLFLILASNFFLLLLGLNGERDRDLETDLETERDLERDLDLDFCDPLDNTDCDLDLDTTDRDLDLDAEFPERDLDLALDDSLLLGDLDRDLELFLT